jgi:tryptophanyl-tRNA synthetase
MSKSAESQAGVLYLLDDISVTAKKVMRAVTDSEGVVRYDRANKPGVSNLLSIQSALTGRSIAQLEEDYAGKQYGHLKQGVRDAVVAEFEPVRARALELLEDPAELDRVLAHNADRAAEVAEVTLKQVYDRVGLLRRG